MNQQGATTVGVVLSMVGNIGVNLGQNLIKYGHTLSDHNGKYAPTEDDEKRGARMHTIGWVVSRTPSPHKPHRRRLGRTPPQP